MQQVFSIVIDQYAR